MIKDLFHTNRPTYSLEVFPPKKDADVSVIYDALDEFKTLHPSFISVTTELAETQQKTPLP